MSDAIKPDPRIAAYIDEISQPGIPYVSKSHHKLADLYAEHGRNVVDQLIVDYFERKSHALQYRQGLPGRG
jgi:hypothetical protein